MRQRSTVEEWWAELFPGICEADRMNRGITQSRAVGRAGQMVASKAGWEAGEGKDSQRAASDQGQEK